MMEKRPQRLPAEIVYAEELDLLGKADNRTRPPGWLLSPRAVETFVLGGRTCRVLPKFVAERKMVTRIIVALATQRGAMLVGEPGTAKSWLSELISAAVSGDSTLVIQGGVAETVQQLLYSWNNAMVESRGHCLEALIPGPLYRGMVAGKLVRYEELARSSPALQDALLSILSERMITIPELGGESTLYAREGFNLIGTSNTLDHGVNEMSNALKRRMNFETIKPIASLPDEIDVVLRESGKLLLDSGVEVEPEPGIVEAMVTIFHELRNGQSIDGRSTDRLSSAVMSTAEAVSVVHAMGVYAFYYHDGQMAAEDFTDFLVGAAVKDNAVDLKRMNHYFETEVSRKQGALWRIILDSWRRDVPGRREAA
jgi:MoxR-like ATPase